MRHHRTPEPNNRSGRSESAVTTNGQQHKRALKLTRQQFCTGGLLPLQRDLDQNVLNRAHHRRGHQIPTLDFHLRQGQSILQ